MTTTTKHPVVFIHGVMGYGNHKPFWNRACSYWPEHALQRLRANYLLVDVGVLSSDHDRACEAFFQLYGGRVDYGQEHAEQTGHCRYGETFDKALFPDWSEENPVHLIGHSLGATTAIELYQLLCEDAFGIGTNSKWVKSIISLAGPLSGSTMGHAFGLHTPTMTPFTLGHAVGIWLSAWAVLYKTFPTLKQIFNYRMPQWERDVSWWGIITGKSSMMASSDLAAYGLLPAQRIVRNRRLQQMNEVYLVSIASSPYIRLPRTRCFLLAMAFFGWLALRISGVHAGPIAAIGAASAAFMLGRRICRSDHATSPILIIMRIFMWWGSHLKYHVYDGFDRQAWKQTDGVVNIYSMLNPMVGAPPSCKPSRSDSRHSHDCDHHPHQADHYDSDADSVASTESESSEIGAPPSPASSTAPLQIDLDSFDPARTAVSRHTRAAAPKLERGRWHVTQVAKNHFLGTQLDRGADDLYAKLLHLIATEFEQQAL